MQKDGALLIVTLNRPEAKNAFTPEMLLGLYKAWRMLDKEDELLCAILTANGDTFCAGMDLKAGADGDQKSSDEFLSIMKEVPNVHWQALLRDNRPNKFHIRKMLNSFSIIRNFSKKKISQFILTICI